MATPLAPGLRNADRLVVVGRAKPRNANGRIIVRCDCGTLKVIYGTNFWKTQTCGCRGKR